ncbi:type III secretion system translocon subunit SctB [Sansalvadorimonas verongulae]|uniref:type III secretion system translocon subunit SctB n=1 Tax=Sansalvadorimonas verongulae TaxID=2172824 RepID=UPI0012BC4EFD|nr:type III secretion system translocon subunit SctB [Sansalvadorimonas verongulae]MTI14151.1 hypothetical protein [Sansalvadorimonas verongulae]
MKINQGQNPVPLDQQPRLDKDAHQAKEASKGARAGHLAGDNLNVGRQQGGQTIHGKHSQGIPKPALNSPAADPTVASYQAAMGHMDKLVDGSQNHTALAYQLHNAGKPANSQPSWQGANEVTVGATEDGFSGQFDGKDFRVDAGGKSFQLELEGKNATFKTSSNGTISATVDGAPLDLTENEVKAYTDFFALMALFHEMGVEQRQMSRQGRNMANKAVVEKIKAQAQEQRSAAAAKMVAGMVGGAVKVASGALNMAGSMKGMKADQAAGGNSQMGNMIAQQWSAMGKMVEGLGEAGASTLQYKAGLHEARSTELRAEEEQARFVKQTEQDQMQVAQELATKARDTFAQTWNQFLQTQQNIARNI